MTRKEVIVDSELHFTDLGKADEEKIIRYHTGPNGTAPVRRVGPEGDACYDIFASHDAEISPFSSTLVDTELTLQLPPYVHFILKEKSGPSNMNCYLGGGVIDNGYRGTIKVHLYYLPFHLLYFETSFDGSGLGRVMFDQVNWKPFIIKKGQKIAQGLTVRVEDYELRKSRLNNTERGTGAYGSTGLFK